MSSFIRSGIVPPPVLLNVPHSLPLSAARASMSLQQKVALGRAPGGSHRRVKAPLTVIEQRGLEAALKMRRVDRPPIFTAEFVLAQGAAVIAQLLDDCWYDLARAERK